MFCMIGIMVAKLPCKTLHANNKVSGLTGQKLMIKKNRGKKEELFETKCGPLARMWICNQGSIGGRIGGDFPAKQST